MKNKTYNKGWIETICGPMFSGKTEELIRRLKRAIIARNKVVVFKPKIDKVITLGKKNNLQSKKNLFCELQNKSSVDKLSKALSQRYEKRKGGYSRVIRSGFRYGDNAPMAIIELFYRYIQAKKIYKKKKSEKDLKTLKESKNKEAEKKI